MLKNISAIKDGGKQAKSEYFLNAFIFCMTFPHFVANSMIELNLFGVNVLFLLGLNQVGGVSQNGLTKTM